MRVAWLSLDEAAPLLRSWLQYLLYLGFLELIDPDRKLYLAISDKTYAELFTQKAIQVIVQRYQLLPLLVNVETEEVVSWTS